MTRARIPAAIVVVVLVASCGRPASPNPPSGPEPRVTIAVGDVTRTFAWQGDAHLRDQIKREMGPEPVTVTFHAGIFEFTSGINLPGARGIRFVGENGAVLRFRELTEWGRIRTSADTPFSDKAFEVNRPNLVRPGHRYQLFLSDLAGGRFLECVVKDVDGTRVTLAWQSVTNPAVKAVPRGAYVIPEINFFDTFRGGDLTFENLTFDGNCDVDAVKLGGSAFYGHTTHCGIIVRNLYRPPEPRPATRGVTLSRCRFRNLLGRAVAIYNVADIAIRDCGFVRVRTEALEIDHWSSRGTITGCRFSRCGAAIQLNDCTDITVDRCLMTRCHHGVRILDALKDRTTNLRLEVRDSAFLGIQLPVKTDPFSDENSFRGNVFIGCGPIAMMLGGDRNSVEANLVLGSRTAAVEIGGSDCVVRRNLFPAPRDDRAGFTPILRR